MVLNSPWFDMQGSAWLRSPAARRGDRAARDQPADAGDPAQDQRRLRPLAAPRARRRVGLRPRPGSRSSPARSTSAGCAPYAAATPSCTPGSTSPARSWCCRRRARASASRPTTTATTHDIVLDVEQIRRWASSVGRHVTSIAVDGAMHDVVLSRPEVRGAGVRRHRHLAGRVGGAGDRPGRLRRAGPRARPRPTTAITARSRAGGSRRPTVAPSWPPTTEPTAIRPATPSRRRRRR